MSRREPREPRQRRWSLRGRVLAAALGIVAAGATAFAATNWVVGLNSGSSGEGQSASINNLTVAAIASPAAGNLLYPGGTGDVVLKITNSNAFPVTLTAVQLPTSTTYAAGYTDSALTTPQATCTAANSLVGWNFATAVSGSSHTLTTPLTVAANGTLTVTLTNDATMASTAPAGCANTYFSLPALTGVTATGGAATATASPATDAWTS
jgi:hypothetical protein